MPATGVLAVQGDFDLHVQALIRAGESPDSVLLVRTPEDLARVDRLIVPGGESTTVGLLLERYGLGAAIKGRAEQGTPIWGTCMGMIVAAHDVADLDQQTLDLIDITVRRNAFGRQIASAEVALPIPILGAAPFPAIFIRAPWIERAGPGVDVLAQHEGHGVFVRQGNVMGTSFHPELTIAESDEALQQLSKCSFQPFPISLAEWRKMDGLLRTQPGNFAMGLRANGEWISYLSGMRKGKLTYVFIQMNHNGFARYSLSTVMRSHFFEHEIARGQEEINFVNGTCSLFQRCCETDTCVTVSAHRGLTAFVILHWIAPWHSAADHALNMQRWTMNMEPTNLRGVL